MVSDSAGTSEWPDGGFPGIRINPKTLMPQLVNEEACAAALAASTDPTDRIFVRLVEGHPGRPPNCWPRPGTRTPTLSGCGCSRPRSCAYRTASTAPSNSTASLAEAQGTPEEATVRQHLGRSHFAAGNIAAAVESFAKALDLRVAGAADASLIYSSTVALQRARDVLDLAC